MYRVCTESESWLLCTLDMECKQNVWNKEYIIDYVEIRLFWSFLFHTYTHAVLAFSFPISSLPAFLSSQLDLFSSLCHMAYDLRNSKKEKLDFAHSVLYPNYTLREQSTEHDTLKGTHAKEGASFI